MKITRLHSCEVLDSRGNPTVEVEVHCRGGGGGEVVGMAIVPSGASTGAAEACELRDGDADRYDGRGVRQAVRNVIDVIAPAVIGMDAAEQVALDERLIELDGTANKSRLGANAILGVSLAAAHAAAAAQGLPLFRHLNRLWCETLTSRGGTLAASRTSSNLPTTPRLPLPMVNMISGGLHAGGNLDFQDFLISPRGAPDYSTGLEWTVRVYRRLGELLSAAGYEGRLVGDEGGYGPRLPSNRQAAEFVVRAIEAAGLTPGDDVTLAIDVAATHFWRDGFYCPGDGELEDRLASDHMIDVLESFVDAFPIASIEDGLAEDDWYWPELTQRLSDRVILIGDDLFATNEARLRRGIEQGFATGILIKVNQIGTLTETLRTMAVARAANYACIVSARSGETEDATIADLAVATGADQIKIGCIVRGERLAKYNRLLRISEQL